MNRRLLAIAGIAYLATGAMAASLVPNGSFEDGTTTPTGWQLSGGIGAWETEGHTGKRSISVTGDGAGSNTWMCPGAVLTAGKIYQIEFWTKSSADISGEFVISGTSACNFDWDVKAPHWIKRTTIARVPPVQPEKQFIRLGHWRAKGKVWFDDVSVREVRAEFAANGKMVLGGGETIANGRYTFVAPLKEGTNVSRPLQEPSPSFDSDRWRISGDAKLLFTHSVSDPSGKACPLSEGRIKVSVIHHRSGVCSAAVSRDAKEWMELGEIAKDGEAEFALPQGLGGAETMYVQLVPKKKEGEARAPSLEVNGYEFSARLGRTVPDMKGATKFVPVK